MNHPKLGSAALGRGLMRLAAIGVLSALALGLLLGCPGFNPSAIDSPNPSGNQAPILVVVEPNEDNLSVSQNEEFIIRWTDSDPDDNARIDIDLVQIDGLSVFELAGGLFENDSNPDLFRARIAPDVPVGDYFLRLTIADGLNTPVVVFAEGAASGNRVQVVVSLPGTGVQNLPPRIFVADPETNVGASQNDIVTITIRPRQDFIPPLPPPPPPDPGEAFHYDREDPVDVTILLDLDNDPNNDDLTVDQGPGHIVLDREFVAENRFDQIAFPITINVQDIPVRQDGLPYFVRATITDGLNVAHSYAAGRLHVLQLVEGSASALRRTVDLGQVGKTLAGARWLGFNPLANLGTKMTSALDQDNDGVGDFIVVAQFGNPRNLGNIGEAYLIYGRELRFGGEININTVATDFPVTSRNRIRGTVFHPTTDSEIPWVVDLDLGDDRRIGLQPITEPYTLGITDVEVIGNLGSGDVFGECSIPELLFGMPHNEYMGTTRDDDYGDDPSDECGAIYCYADDLPNNYATEELDDDPQINLAYTEAPIDEFAIEEKGGTVALYYGENNILAIDFQEDPDDGIACTNNIAPSTRVFGLTACGSQMTDDDQRIYGARFNVAIYDNFGAAVQPIAPFPIEPLNAHYGMNVGVLPDIDLNGFQEIIISSPRNELESADLLARFGEAHPHMSSRLSRANVTVFLGQDFRNLDSRLDGTSHIPFITARVVASCSPQPDTGCFNPRALEVDYSVEGAGAPDPAPADPNLEPVTVEPGWFLIRGENPRDKLGGATTAGDFNLDGPADVLCGAPFNDPQLDLDSNGIPETNIQDAGKVYIVYNRFPYGNIELPRDSDSDDFRSPMLRIFGEGQSDHLGLKQESGRDVNGDAIDDVFIGSQDYNGQGLINNGFVGIVFGGQPIDGDRTVSQLATTELNGTRLYGTHTGDLFGADLSTAGDFNQDGLGDLLVSAPGETVNLPGEDKPRRGVVYLIFGGGHLDNRVFTANQIGTAALPGIVFVGPYQLGTPDAYELDQRIFVIDGACDPDPDMNNFIDDPECLCDPELYEFDDCAPLGGRDAFTLRRLDDAAPSRVGFIGDVNNDGFDDIMIGNPTADFVDPSLPGEARRRDAGEAYLIYGNNFGANNVIGGQ